MSLFLEASKITSFCKKPDQVNQLEKTIRELTDKFLPILEKALGARVARLEISIYMILITRRLF